MQRQDGDTAFGGLRRLDVDELRERLTSLIGMAYLILAGVIATLLLPQTEFHSSLFLAVLSVALTGAVCYALGRRRPRLARALLLLLPMASFAWALVFVPSPAVPFYATPLLIASAAINPLLGFAVASVSTASILVIFCPHPLGVPAVIVIWLVATMTWLSSRGQYTALGWASASHQRAHALLDLQEQWRAQLTVGGASALPLRLVDSLFVSPFISIQSAQETLGVTYHTARNQVLKLEEAGIIVEVTGGNYRKIYLAPEIPRIVRGLQK